MKIDDLTILYDGKPLSIAKIRIVGADGEEFRYIRRLVVELSAEIRGGSARVLEAEQLVRDGSGQLVIEQGAVKTETIRRVTREG